ncbi:MAG: hypothetical protein DDT25_00120 [Chloroflexi bacterium]|nr:hypothetical protein [Chloroflexota bacterium]
MRPSRGMGAIRPSKMPKAKKVIRKDNPDVVDVYARGGKTRKSKPSPSQRLAFGTESPRGITRKRVKDAERAPARLGKRKRLRADLIGMRKLFS